MIDGLAKNLKLLRTNQNLTRKQVAERIGVSVSQIGFYESGTRQPSLDALMKLAGVYHVSTDYLLGIKSTTKSNKTLSLEGLTDKQIEILKSTADCFREQNRG